MQNQEKSSSHTDNKRGRRRFNTRLWPLPWPQNLRFPLGLQIPGNIDELQRQDDNPCKYIQKVTGSEVQDKDGYFLHNGIIYRQQGPMKQLVVLKEVRQTVLESSKKR